MAQSDQVVQNATFPTVRADINDNLAALYSQNSGNSAPAVTVAFQPWVDTSSSPPVWKVRNGSNSDWITVGVLDPAGFNAGGVTAIANGGTSATTATAALAALLPSQSGNTGKALVTDGSAAAWNTVSGITNGTAVASTSGTAIDFTGIPSTAKRVTVMFNGVSTSGTSNLRIQIGSGSVDNTGYSSSYGNIGAASVSGAINSTSGWEIFNPQTNSTNSGIATICLLGSNIWTFSSLTSAVTTANTILVGGVTTALSGTLDRLRIIGSATGSPSDTFDAGSINLLLEG
jgi:hypothetical protein